MHLGRVRAQAVEAARPARPIRIVVGCALGAGAVAAGRAWTARLAENIGQPVVVDDRGGATGTISARIVVRSFPGGCTIFFLKLTEHLSTPT